MTTEKSFPYTCELDVTFPTKESAKRTTDVMCVDEEVGNRVVKTLEILPSSASTDEQGASNMIIMRVSFKATEAKMLRVAVSGFCDYLNVALKCQQEFDQIQSE
eukprot:CAMPEP_0119022800 /NCGR_PEP_ID=MMETSP1176-20130426/28763_1 /TAXON_ID=265551 /ORGANISM="Synedropsis recta cf, Strain CCMP1620" /LENGTH=103 /DNA_ID=CAMNT_0006977739 /DNA_START=4 /DNA_END=315 /DNA_ORIENTATION=+